MAGLVERASGWVKDHLRTLVERSRTDDEVTTLRAEQQLFLALLDALDEYIVLGTPDGRLRFANHTAAAELRRMTGRDPEELVGKLPTDMALPGDLGETILAHAREVIASGAPVSYELLVPQPGGGTRWGEQTISPVFTDGRLTAQVMSSRYIDKRKGTQRRLELLSKVSALVGNLELEELLPAIARLSIPELADWSAIDVRDAESVRRTYVGQRDPARAELAARLQRFQPWSGRAGWPQLAAGRSLFYPRVTDELLATSAQSADHLEVLRQLELHSVIAVPLRTRDTTVAVLTFGVTAESGRHYCHADLELAEELARRAAVLFDRARLHAELKASDARFRIALSSGGRTAVFEQDRELRYIWHYNVALGRSAIGMKHGDIFPDEEATALTKLKQHVLDTGESFLGEVGLSWGGKQHCLTATIDPVRDDSGAIVGIIGAATDISEEKHVQDELTKAVSFREQLMGILGHDLRNPLAAILAATSLMRRRPDLLQPVREHVDRIERSARRMAEMIRTLLDFTQVRMHGSLPVSPAPTDLAEVARLIVDELRAPEPTVDIELTARGDTHGVWDAARLGELISNLVSNALTHGDGSEPVRILIDDEGDHVCVRVHNAGKPITPQTKATLFQPFRRGDGDHGSRQGLGLGLYIVRQIVLAHHGVIDVDSAPHAGTTFSVRLPRLRAHARAS